MPEDQDSVATEPEEGREAPSEETSTQDDLNDLLDEWEVESEQKAEETTKSEDKPDDRVQHLEQKIKDIERRDAEKSFNEGVQKSVNEVMDGMEESLYTAQEVEDFLWARAARDDKFQNAFLQRGLNPKGWSKVLKAMGKELSQRAKTRPDPQATSDSDAVAAAVRGSSNRVSEAEEDFSKVNQMNDQEFEKFVQTL